MRLARCAASLCAALALSTPARAQQILDLRYDGVGDRLLAQIAYRGTNDRHRFDVAWGSCRKQANPPSVAGRIIDQQGDDAAREDYRVTARLPLAALPCRPAVVTLRLGRVSHATIFVP